MLNEMYKDFDCWNELKKTLEKRVPVFCNERELWWCSIGANIGTETSGKNELFERPVLILEVYNKHSIRVVPLTSKVKNDRFHTKLDYQGRQGWAILSHSKTISSKRLQRKLYKINMFQHEWITRRLEGVYHKRIGSGFPEPRSRKA